MIHPFPSPPKKYGWCFFRSPTKNLGVLTYPTNPNNRGVFWPRTSQACTADDTELQIQAFKSRQKFQSEGSSPGLGETSHDRSLVNHPPRPRATYSGTPQE